MAKKRHTAEQIIAKLREAEVELAKGQPMSKVVRKLGVPEDHLLERSRRTDHGLARKRSPGQALL